MARTRCSALLSCLRFVFQVFAVTDFKNSRERDGTQQLHYASWSSFETPSSNLTIEKSSMEETRRAGTSRE